MEQKTIEFIKNYNNLNTPIFIAFVENGKIILRDTGGTEMPSYLADYIDYNNISLEHYTTLTQAQKYIISKMPIPPEIVNKLIEFENEE